MPAPMLDQACTNCGRETYERSRNGYCAVCAPGFEADWDADDGTEFELTTPDPTGETGRPCR